MALPAPACSRITDFHQTGLTLGRVSSRLEMAVAIVRFSTLPRRGETSFERLTQLFAAPSLSPYQLA